MKRIDCIHQALRHGTAFSGAGQVPVRLFFEKDGSPQHCVGEFFKFGGFNLYGLRFKIKADCNSSLIQPDAGKAGKGFVYYVFVRHDIEFVVVRY